VQNLVNMIKANDPNRKSWIVTLDAPTTFRIEGEKQETQILSHLELEGKK